MYANLRFTQCAHLPLSQPLCSECRAYSSQIQGTTLSYNPLRGSGFLLQQSHYNLSL